MEKLSIKNATIIDIPVIRELAMQVWPQTYNPIVGAEQVSYMLNRFYSPEALSHQMQDMGHTFILCYYDGIPVAFAAWSEMETGTWKLHKLYIIPGQQGRGIGRFILAFMTNELKTTGATAIRVNVNRFNHPAIAFYEKTGFKPFAEEDIDIGNGYFMNDYVLNLPIVN